MMNDKVRKMVARVATHRSVGLLISIIKNNRIGHYNCLYDTHFKEVIDPVKASIFWGLYEKDEAFFVEKHLSGSYPVLELGGSLGIISCVIGKKLLGRKLLVVEANRSLLPVIERNLSLNNIQNAFIVCGGIGEGKHLYFIEGNRSYNGEILTQYRPHSIEVENVDVDSLLSAHGVGPFSLVSDIEGAENCLLFDSPSSLIKCQEMIIELHQSYHKGRLLTVSDQKFQIRNLGFDIIDSRGNVIYARRIQD